MRTDGNVTRREGGFTLVEVLLAAAIVTVVIVALSGLIVLSMRTNAAAGDQTASVALAQERMELLEHADYSDLTVGGSHDTPVTDYLEYIDSDGNGRADFLVTWMISTPSLSGLDPSDVSIRSLSVRCTPLRSKNGQPGRPKQVTLFTYRAEKLGS